MTQHKTTPTTKVSPPQPQRFVGRPIRLPKKCAPPKGLVITTVVTVVLLVISLMILCIALLVAPTERVEEDGGDGGGKKDAGQAQTQPIAPPSGIKQKTAIRLPCTTSSASSYSFDNVAQISTESQAAALIDVTNGRAVAEKNGSEKVYPASMTKVMTLLVACEKATDPTALLTVTAEMDAKYKASYNPGEQGPSILTGWKVGDQLTVEDALHLVIYASDTYACWLLAEHIAGSEAAFVQMMNDRAAQLGLSGTTHFENSTGLYHDNHYTTCFDMAMIMAAAMKNEAARTVLTSNQQYLFDVYNNGAKKGTLSSYSGWYTNRLEAYPYGGAAPYYAGNGSDIKLIAGKTGYETIPKYCFVTAGENDVTGTLFICVQVGGDSPRGSTDDTREIYQQFATY